MSGKRSVIDRLYRDYQRWKSWDLKIESIPSTRVFRKEARRVGLWPGCRILEVGFGRGHFLDWCNANGYDISGVDLVPELVANAKSRGHDVYCGSLSEQNPWSAVKFDFIVLFDVLEHLTFEEIETHFSIFSEVLNSGGRIIARFPNGASPFGRYYQYRDATHKSVLTDVLVEQIVLRAGFSIAAVHNAAWDIESKRLRRLRVFVPLLVALRTMVQWAICGVYFGRNVPLDPNITVIWEFADQANFQ